MTGAAIQSDQRASESDLPALMVRYQRGEPPAVEELVRRLSPALYRYLSFPRVPPADAEDLLQDCWLRIHRSRHTYRPQEPLLPWLYAIARHTRLDGYRRQRRRTSHEVLFADPPDVASRGRTEAPAKSGDLLAMLEHLPASQREVMLMLKVSGMSLEEAARASSSTVGAIKQRAHRAYSKLRSLLEKPEKEKCPPKV